MRRVTITFAVLAAAALLPLVAAAEVLAPAASHNGLAGAGEDETAAGNLFCLDFIFFCDGLEVVFEGDSISGIWRNRLCEGIDSPLVGVVEDGIPNPCVPETGRAGLACIPDLGCDQVNDDEFFFVFNEPDGVVDMGYSTHGITPPPGACAFVGGVSYQVLSGPCPFGPEGSDAGQPWISSEHAFR